MPVKATSLQPRKKMSFIYEGSSSIATLTLDNPPVNALGAADTYALAGLLDGYRTREDVRVVYFLLII